MHKIIKRIARILKGGKRISRQYRLVTIIASEYKIVIPPLTGKSGEYHQIATVYKDDKVIGQLQVDGKVISPFSMPMDINKIWSMPKELAKALREKGYRFPYIYTSRR